MKELFRENKKYDIGIISYPIGVLFSLFAFKNEPIFASLLWASLSFGDGFAALVGTSFGKHKVISNSKKSIEGMLAFFLSTVISGIFIFILLTAKFPINFSFKFYLLILIVFSFFLSLVEIFPFKFTDNIFIPILGFIFLYPFQILSNSGAYNLNFHFQYIDKIAILFIFVLGAEAFFLKWLNLKGASAAIIFGILIIIFSGASSIILLIMFFILSILATKFKFSYKLKKNIAESKTGIRGLYSVIPKGILPVFVSFLIFLSGNSEYFIFSFVVVIATSTFDTVSSEIGKAISRYSFSLIKLKKVKSGESGAISLQGTLAGILASLLIMYSGAILLHLPQKFVLTGLLITIIANLFEPFFYKVLYNSPLTKPTTNFLLLSLSFFLALLSYPYIT